MTSTELRNQVYDNPGESYWLKGAIQTAGQRDVLDALADAETLLRYCQLRAAEAGIPIR